MAQGELFKDTKERISKRTGIKGKQLEKIKFALLPKGAYPKPEYIEDGKLKTPDSFRAQQRDSPVDLKTCVACIFL